MDKINCNTCGAINSSSQKYCTKCGYALPKVNIEIPSSKLEHIKGQVLEYNFEFTDQKYLLNLFGLIFVPFVLLMFSALWLGFAVLIAAFVVPILIYWFNRKNIKKKGQAILSETFAEINLVDRKHIINFNEIKSYQVDYMNGVTLKILFTNRSELTLVANSNFCNEEQLEIFCDEFEKAIANFKGENQSKVIRTKSLFEKSWMYFVLVGMSIIIGIVFLLAEIEGKDIPGSIWVALGGIASMWAAYYKSKSKGKIKRAN
jgi:hypothetical protein